MISINEKSNVWFIPSYSRNAVSTFRLRELITDDFELYITIKTDWKKLIQSEQKFGGILCLNGLHFGILCKYDAWGGRQLAGEVWSIIGEEKHNDVAQISLEHNSEDIDKDWRDIKFTYKKNESITLETKEGKVTTMLKGNIADYKESYMWLGCADNHLHSPDEYKGNWFGSIKKMRVMAKNKLFADFDFKTKTRYKIYDKSGNGNHLLKKFINDEGHVVVF